MFAWGSVGGRLAKPHPPATGCRSPLAGQRRSELRSRSARPAELLDDPVGRSCRMSDGVDRQTLEILAREFGRMILSGTGVECAHKGSLRGLGDARPETNPWARGGFSVTTIDFRSDPVKARRHRVVSLVTHADIPDIVRADDETGCCGVRGRDEGRQIVVEQSGPIRIVTARRRPCPIVTMPSFGRGQSVADACKGTRIPRELREAPNSHYLSGAG